MTPAAMASIGRFDRVSNRRVAVLAHMNGISVIVMWLKRKYMGERAVAITVVMPMGRETPKRSSRPHNSHRSARFARPSAAITDLITAHLNPESFTTAARSAGNNGGQIA